MPWAAWGPSGPSCPRWTWPTSCARRACRCSRWRAAGPWPTSTWWASRCPTSWPPPTCWRRSISPASRCALPTAPRATPSCSPAARAPTTRSPTRRSSTSSWWGRAKSSCPRCWRSSASCAHPARPGPRFCARWRDAWGAPTCRACTAGAARTRPRLPAAGRSPCSTTCRVWCTSASSRVSPTARRSSP